MARRAHWAAATVAAMVLAGTIGKKSAHTQSLFSALPETALAPSDNPTTAAKVALGRALFWDPILSGNKDVACATCHHPDFGYAENLATSIGVDGVGLGAVRAHRPTSTVPIVKRNSQTVLNTAFNGIGQGGQYEPAAAPMFWDLRVKSLEAQAIEPISALEEMRGAGYEKHEILPQVIARLAGIAEYRVAFARAFGPANAVNATNLGKALASFERSLVATNSPFDRYMRGDTSAMTPAELRGMGQFERSGCANCHNGAMFSDYQAHVLAVPDNALVPESDTGVNNTYAFRTPSLRNLAFTAPYMHSGVFRTLDDVVRFYDNVRGGRGGRGRRGGGQLNPLVDRSQLDPLLRQVNVRGGRGDLVAFLTALNDAGFDRTIPERVPSGLPPGGAIH